MQTSELKPVHLGQPADVTEEFAFWFAFFKHCVGGKVRTKLGKPRWGPLQPQAEDDSAWTGAGQYREGRRQTQDISW